MAKSLEGLPARACLVTMFTKFEESCVNTSQQASVSQKPRRHSAFAVEGDLRAVFPVLLRTLQMGLNNRRGDNRLFTPDNCKLKSIEYHNKHLPPQDRKHG
jgi:hypothetical protein